MNFVTKPLCVRLFLMNLLDAIFLCDLENFCECDHMIRLITVQKLKYSAFINYA